jgi:TolA-binding protein
MRYHLLAALLLAGTAMPAEAQRDRGTEQRIQKLEQELRAVQRKVFPAGNVEPEIRPQVGAPLAGGIPASTPVADLTARLDAMEAQLARITGQHEENSYKVRQLEESLNKFKGDAEFRLAAIEQSRAGAAEPAEEPSAEAAQPRAAAPAAVRAQAPAPARAEAPAPRKAQLAAAAPAPEAPAPAAEATAPVDEAEDAYLDGFRMWEGGKYAEAAPVLEGMAKKYPKHRRASYAQNLAGRAYLDDGKPATAAKLFLANYQANPKGDRAADSLYFLGQALAKLDKDAEACKVYDELEEVYPDMRPWLKQRLPQARSEAGCAS